MLKIISNCIFLQNLRFRIYFLNINPDVKPLKSGAMLTLGVWNGTICHESILQNKSNTQMAINGKQTHPGCVLLWASWPAWQKQQGTLAQKNTNTHTCSCLHVYLCYICAPHSSTKAIPHHTASNTKKTATSLPLHSCKTFYFANIFCVNKQQMIVFSFTLIREEFLYRNKEMRSNSVTSLGWKPKASHENCNTIQYNIFYINHICHFKGLQDYLHKLQPSNTRYLKIRLKKTPLYLRKLLNIILYYPIL